MCESHNWKWCFTVWKSTSTLEVFESKKTCISIMGGHDKGEHVLGKTRMQLIIVQPTDKALSWGGGSKEALETEISAHMFLLRSEVRTQ